MNYASVQSSKYSYGVLYIQFFNPEILLIQLDMTYLPFKGIPSDMENLKILYNVFGFYVQFLLTILEHIKAIRRNIEVELKELLKLCGWERSESLLSIKNSKSTRNKLRDLIEKYNVRNMWSISLSLML
uniref:Uncharacterized protein n=1 Tax=Quercus lobata TaxID=97700 RepID=A0A7N2KR71_QUELO